MDESDLMVSGRTWRVIALETKRNAVGRALPYQSEWWLLFQQRFPDRVREIPGSASLIGCDWEIDVDDEDHGRWLIEMLQGAAGFGPTMLRLSRAAVREHAEEQR